jgi:hypothetical protein
VVDDVGEERILAKVTGGHAEVWVRLADAVPGYQSMVVLSAGSDRLLGPMVGVHLWADGDRLAWFSGWRDGADPCRPASTAALDRPPLVGAWPLHLRVPQLVPHLLGGAIGGTRAGQQDRRSGCLIADFFVTSRPSADRY